MRARIGSSTASLLNEFWTCGTLESDGASGIVPEIERSIEHNHNADAGAVSRFKRGFLRKTTLSAEIALLCDALDIARIGKYVPPLTCSFTIRGFSTAPAASSVSQGFT
jgi:hypothetical protein